jgi:hypothetical protein
LPSAINSLYQEIRECIFFRLNGAAIYSLIETTRANGLEPYWCLKYLFENLLEAMTADEFMDLMPQNIDKTIIAGPVR